MKEHEFLTDFDDEDIVQFRPRNEKYIAPEMMKLGRLRKAIEAVFRCGQLNDFIISALSNASVRTHAHYKEGRYTCTQYWFQNGMDCEILKLGTTNWQSGKIRIRVALEFVPDEIDPEIEENCDESPLAEIRQEIENVNV